MKTSQPSPIQNQKEPSARTESKAGQSVSPRAMQETKRGEPWRADQPKDRSPKQESLYVLVVPRVVLLSLRAFGAESGDETVNAVGSGKGWLEPRGRTAEEAFQIGDGFFGRIGDFRRRIVSDGGAEKSHDGFDQRVVVERQYGAAFAVSEGDRLEKPLWREGRFAPRDRSDRIVKVSR